MRGQGDDPFSFLGVGVDATDAEIKAAFREKSKIFHPDKGGSEDAFNRLVECYSVLCDPVAKAEAASRRGKGRGPSAGSFDSIDELPATGMGSARGLRTRGADRRAVLEITLEQAFVGGLFEVGGSMLKVEPGASSGMIGTVVGAGEKGRLGGRSGNLVVDIVVSKHPMFSRIGADLTMPMRMAVWDAALGGRWAGKGLDGKQVTLEVPPGTQPGREFVIQGRGMPDGKGGRGDLVVVASVRIPDGSEEPYATMFEKMRAEARSHR